MKFVTLSAIFAFLLAAAPEAGGDQHETRSSRTMVGVLMDAQCPAIVGESRHSESGVRTASAKRKTAAREGTRGRSVASKADTDGDRFESCKATSSTTAFAFHTDGNLYILNDTGNDMVRQQMRNESFRSSLSTESGEPRWLTLMVEGRPSGDTLEVISLRR